VLTTKRLALGKKLNPMWSIIPRLFVLVMGRRIVFEIPLDQIRSIRNDPEEMGLYFILRTITGIEYPINSDALIGKSNDEWIRALTDAVRLANPDVLVREQASSVEFVTAGSESESERQANHKEEAVHNSSPATPVHSSPPGVASAITYLPLVPQLTARTAEKKNTEKIILAVIGGLVVLGVVVIAAGALYFKQRGPRPPEGMVYVPGGEFTMGRDDGDEYERPAHKVKVDRFLSINTKSPTRIGSPA
jgi:hypothetical protein